MPAGSVSRDELSLWLRLALSPGVGARSARALLAAFGLPDAVFGQSDATLAQTIDARQVRALRQGPEDLDGLLIRTWDWLQADDHHLLTLADPHYPPGLLNLDDPPLLLHVVGPTAQLPGTAGSLAIVGSRNPTPQGLGTARQFARALAGQGVCVVSGLALGIDGAAHEGALDATEGMTVAVIGTGADRVYPRAHQALAHRIAQQGWIVSEYALGTPSISANFPRRNRLIAALSCGTLVVEAAVQSGSLITARLAAELGREVFAVPGSIHAAQSRGCHALIRQGAKLVESVEDILEELPVLRAAGTRDEGAPEAKGPSPAAPSDVTASPQDSRILDAMGFDPVDLDALLARTGLSAPALQARLLELELDGQIGRLPGGRFQRIGRA